MKRCDEASFRDLIGMADVTVLAVSLSDFIVSGVGVPATAAGVATLSVSMKSSKFMGS